MQELLAEIEGELNVQDLASAEQGTFKELLGSVLRGANKYVQGKLNPGRGGWRQFLGSVLDDASKYAENRLQPSVLLDQLVTLNEAMEQSNSLPELTTEIRDSIRNYLRSKLDPDSGEVDARQQEVEEVKSDSYAPSEAKIEQNLKDLLGEVSRSVRNYLVQKLEPDASIEEEMEAREEALSALLPLLKPVATSLLANLISGNSNQLQGPRAPYYYSG